MEINKDKYLQKFKVTNKEVEKTRWDFCKDIANLTGKRTIQISTLMAGMKTNEVKDFYLHAKTFTRGDIEFWKLLNKFKEK